ncbi:MAG: hypothetical protein HXY40_09055 [Chloroflexi bacterium]|nr:hypothetical protein [Chloroflexota bacterium]
MLDISEFKHVLAQTQVPLLSLYLNVDPAAAENQATPAAWSIFLKNTLKRIDTHLEPTQIKLWHDLRARVEEYFGFYKPESKGLALFYGATIEQTYPLAARVANQAAFGEPLVTPLLWLLDEYEPYVVVVVNHSKATLLTVSLGQIVSQEDLLLEMKTAEWHEKTFMPGGGYGMHASKRRDLFNNRVEAQHERFHKQVAQYAQALCEKQEAKRLVLGGDHEAAHAVFDLLPPQVRVGVIDIAALPHYQSSAEILHKVAARVSQHERQRETALVDELVNAAKGHGRAVLGQAAVEAAFEQGKVELLAAAWPGGAGVEKLALRALRAGAEIELVYGAAAERLAGYEGAAARLYYR